jgi:RNA polymerase sigma-70 factor, ECF subfamily
MQIPTDADLIRASHDDSRAFAPVFDRHFEAVHRYAQSRVGPDLADEIAAETFTCAFDQRRRYDLGYVDARPWLLGIASNLIRRHWRTERRRLAAHARSRQTEPGSHEATPAGDMTGALDALRWRDREALLLFAWADLTYEEIAIAQRVPVGTVRSRIARARRTLRAWLADTSSLRVHARPRKESANA